jgi:hypothetical protein
MSLGNNGVTKMGGDLPLVVRVPACGMLREQPIGSFDG